MNVIKGVIFFAVLCVLGYYIYSEKFASPKTQELIDNVLDKAEVKKRFDDEGKLKADAEFVEGKHHGIAHNYYDNGSLHSEISYKHGIKHGNSTWFYENGKTYRVTPYVDGKKSGLQKKYYKSGVLMSEIPFLEDVVQVGTKEYWETGNLKTDYPTMYVDLEGDNQVSVYLDPKVKDAQFVGYVNLDSKPVKVLAKQIGDKFLIDLSDFTHGKVAVRAEFKTKMNNDKVLSKEIKF